MTNKDYIDKEKKVIGNYFSNLIKSKGLAIEQIEKQSGLSKTIIYKILAGKGYNVESLLILGGFFGLTMRLQHTKIKEKTCSACGKIIKDKNYVYCQKCCSVFCKECTDNETIQSINEVVCFPCQLDSFIDMSEQ